MENEAYRFIVEFLDNIKYKITKPLIDKDEIQMIFSQYPFANRVNIGFDIVNNELTNVKCYIGAKVDTSDKFTKDLCQKFINGADIQKRELAQKVFNPNLFSLTENSFSLMKEKYVPLTFTRNVLAARLKGMQVSQMDMFVKALSDLSSYNQLFQKIQSVAETIFENNGTKKHPLFIFGINCNTLNRFDEIKLYYDIYQYDCYDDLYAHNDYGVAIKTANALVDKMNDLRMKALFPALSSLFFDVEGVLAIYGVNFRQDGSKINKFYFIDGNKTIDNRRKFMSKLHETIFEHKMSENNLDLLDKTIEYGFSPAEMCIATDGDNAMLKVYFSTAY